MKKLLGVLLLVLTLVTFTGCSNDTLVVYTEAGFAPFEYVSNGKIVIVISCFFLMKKVTII